MNWDTAKKTYATTHAHFYNATCPFDGNFVNPRYSFTNTARDEHYMFCSKKCLKRFREERSR